MTVVEKFIITISACCNTWLKVKPLQLVRKDVLEVKCRKEMLKCSCVWVVLWNKSSMWTCTLELKFIKYSFSHFLFPSTCLTLSLSLPLSSPTCSTEESQGEIEVKDPCACESLVEFQQATMSSLEQLTQKYILLLKTSSFRPRVRPFKLRGAPKRCITKNSSLRTTACNFYLLSENVDF